MENLNIVEYQNICEQDYKSARILSDLGKNHSAIKHQKWGAVWADHARFLMGNKNG